MARAASPAASPAAAPRSRDTTDLAAARTLVRALDGYHLDPLVGLIVPGLGDLLTAIVGGFVVVVAARHGVAPIVIARMLLNLGIDVAVGVVPLVGDLADLGYRANKKNLALLEARHAGGGAASWRDWAAVGGAGLACLGAIALSVWLLVRLVTAIF